MTLGEVSRRSHATTANKGAKKSAKHLYRIRLAKQQLCMCTSLLYISLLSLHFPISHFM